MAFSLKRIICFLSFFFEAGERSDLKTLAIVFLGFISWEMITFLNCVYISFISILISGEKYMRSILEQ